MTWGEQTRQRTGRISAQGPDQIIPYCTRRSFMLMHESLVRLESMMTELGTTDVLSQIHLRVMVTLMAENFFSLMRIIFNGSNSPFILTWVIGNGHVQKYRFPFGQISHEENWKLFAEHISKVCFHHWNQIRVDWAKGRVLLWYHLSCDSNFGDI